GALFLAQVGKVAHDFTFDEIEYLATGAAGRQIVLRYVKAIHNGHVAPEIDEPEVPKRTDNLDLGDVARIGSGIELIQLVDEPVTGIYLSKELLPGPPEKAVVDRPLMVRHLLVLPVAGPIAPGAAGYHGFVARAVDRPHVVKLLERAQTAISSAQRR